MIPILNDELVKVNSINNNQHHTNPFKTLHHINENWHLKQGAISKTHKNSTNSSISFSSSASTNSTSTIVNNLSNLFGQSKPPSLNKLNETSLHKEFNNNYYSKSREQSKQEEEKTDSEENAEYFYEENLPPHEYDDKDVISLNVDFSSDCIILDETKNLDDNLGGKLNESPKPCSTYNEGMYRCEINPKKYTLELSELSSESFTSSESTLPGCECDANGELSSSSSSSISYYDDFYVSSKVKRDKNKLKSQPPRSSTLSVGKNLTYVSSNFDKNLIKSNSTLKRYSLYANELDNFVNEKKRASQINESFSDSSSSLSLLVDSSSSVSSCSIPKMNSNISKRNFPKKKIYLEKKRSTMNEKYEINSKNLVKNKTNLEDRNKFKGIF